MIHLHEQIAEVNREIQLREKCYPKWVNQGTLSPNAARQRLEALRAALETLHNLNATQTLSAHEAGKELPY